MQNVKSWRKLFGIFKGKKFSLISTSPPPPTIEPRGLFSGVVLAKHSSLNTHSFLLEPIKHQRPQIPTYLHSCVMCWLVICTPSRRHHYILPITTFRQLCWILLIWSVHWNILFDKMQPEVQTKKKSSCFSAWHGNLCNTCNTSNHSPEYICAKVNFEQRWSL